MTPAPDDPLLDLPEPLPAGERVLWRGRPDWRALAVGAFHIRKLAFYFAVLVAWQFASAVADGKAALELVAGTATFGGLAVAGCALVALFAYLTARTTIYTITSRRILMRVGIALPMTLNIPFRTIASAAVKIGADGTGDLPISIATGERVAFLVLWPHARPWRVARPEPMLRAVPQAQKVAALLADALSAGMAAPGGASAQAARPVREHPVGMNQAAA